MAIKFFLMYAGGLLACSIVLLTLVKQVVASFAAGKKPILYGSVSGILASVAVYASTYITDHLFTVFWIFAGIFLLFGVLHMYLIHNSYFTYGAGNDTKVFFGELMFALSILLFTIVIFSSLQYFLKDKSFLFYPMMLSTLTFFVPVLFVHTFEAAYAIPSPVYPTWQYPIDEPIALPDDNPNEKLLVIGFEIAKKRSDSKRTYFRAKAPENIKLGELFYHFINDYNELQSETPIEFYDHTYGAHEWWFRTKPKWYQSSRILDPNISIRDNEVKENTVIMCDRISSNNQPANL